MFTWLSILTGLALIGLGLWMRIQSLASQSWPCVTGKIMTSQVDDHNLEDIRPHIVYLYTVQGKTLQGTRIAYSGYSINRASIEKIVARYPVNTAVKVYYNPQNPSQSVLDNQVSQDWHFWVGCGLAFLGLAVYLSGLN